MWQAPVTRASWSQVLSLKGPRPNTASKPATSSSTSAARQSRTSPTCAKPCPTRKPTESTTSSCGSKPLTRHDTLPCRSAMHDAKGAGHRSYRGSLGTWDVSAGPPPGDGFSTRPHPSSHATVRDCDGFRKIKRVEDALYFLLHPSYFFRCRSSPIVS